MTSRQSERSSPKIRRIKPVTLSANTLEALAEFVRESGLKVGDRLPAERVIGKHLGVSRPIVREALSRWAALGVVETINGRGTFLRRAVEEGTQHVVLTLGTERERLLELVEVRTALETEAAALAALRATPEQVQGLWEALEAVERAYALRNDAPEEDWAFHLKVYQATGNPMFERFIEAFHSLFHRFWENPLNQPEFAKRGLPYHRALVESIAGRDPEAARAAVRMIMKILKEDLSRGGEGREADL